MIYNVESNEELQKVLTSHDEVFLKVGGAWCGPCKQVDKVLKDIENSYPYLIVFVDVDKVPDVASQFKVRSIPCMGVVKNFKFVNEPLVGFHTGKDILKNMGIK